MTSDHMIEAAQLAARAERLIAAILDRSAPLPVAPAPRLAPISDKSVRNAKTPNNSRFVAKKVNVHHHRFGPT